MLAARQQSPSAIPAMMGRHFFHVQFWFLISLKISSPPAIAPTIRNAFHAIHNLVGQRRLRRFEQCQRPSLHAKRSETVTLEHTINSESSRAKQESAARAHRPPREPSPARQRQAPPRRPRASEIAQMKWQRDADHGEEEIRPATRVFHPFDDVAKIATPAQVAKASASSLCSAPIDKTKNLPAKDSTTVKAKTGSDALPAAQIQRAGFVCSHPALFEMRRPAR